MTAPRLTAEQRFVRAARGEPVDGPPVWLMRQAGRYLPEYREIRKQHGFLEMCGSPDLAVEVSLQPWHRFGVDGVVVFSDILLPLAALGVDLEFAPGPRIANPVTSAADLARLEGDPTTPMEPTCEAIRRIKRETGDGAAVIGFAGAPWTLAAYASETKLSRDLEVLSALSWRDPEFVDALLDRMADVTAETLRVQIEAGADVVQIFDTWAGMLSAARFERFAGAALRKVIERLPPASERPPLILFARGAAHLVEALADLGPEVVSLDWRTDLADAAARIGSRVSLQGNLEPTALAARPETIAAAVDALIEAGRKARGHILNLGHGVLPSIPVAGVEAFVRAAQRARA